MKCYICNRIQTSDEHVPAKCFFPTNKRLNLIKVPSCVIHNSKTSKDDEYIRNVITLNRAANNTAVEHFRNKGKRSLERRPALLARIAQNPKFLNLIENDETTKNLTFEVERERFDKVMKKIAYGLYFHKYKKTWEKELVVSADWLITDSYKTDFLAPEIKKFSILKPNSILEGDNPEVFQYTFTDFPSQTEKFAFFRFYEVLDIYVFPMPGSKFAAL